MAAERLRAAGSCACLNLRKAARAVTQFYDGELQVSGLRTTQFSLLAALAARGPLTIGAFAEALVMDRTTLTRNLRPLEQSGFVERRAGPDRRSRVIALTRSGRQALTAAYPLWRRAQQRFLEAFGEDEGAALLAALDRAVLATHAGSSARP